jgi:hypothetical protein
MEHSEFNNSGKNCQEIDRILGSHSVQTYPISTLTLK